MKFYFFVFLIISVFQISIQLSVKVANREICKAFLINKNNKCKQKSHSDLLKTGYNDVCVCHNIYAKPIWTNTTLQLLANSDYSPFMLYFKIKKPIVLDKKLPIFEQNLLNISNLNVYFRFRYIKGFGVDSFNDTITFYLSINFEFFDSSLAFFSNGRQLKSCLDFPSQTRSLFQMFKYSNKLSDLMNFNFIGKKYQPVCPLAFENTHIRSLVLGGLSNTFYRTSIPTFLDLPQNITNINSNIWSLGLYGNGEITLSHRIINRYVFNFTVEFTFEIRIYKIEKGLFKSFKTLKIIEFYRHYWRKLAHKGLDWIYDLNSDVRVDLNDSALIREYFKNNSVVTIVTCQTLNDQYLEGLTHINPFPNEDFCIYAKFPFEQMVFIFPIDITNQFYRQIMCMHIWLIHPKYLLIGLNGSSIPDYVIKNLKKLEKLIDRCEFSKRLQKCNKSDFHPKESRFIWTYSQTKEIFFLIKFIFTISIPLICLIGILTNLIVIATVHYKPNEKEMKENQYSYMSLNAFCNLSILSFQSISLISECDYINNIIYFQDYGIFCSSVRRNAFSQFYRIIFVEFLTHVFNVMSNLSFICYSINRLSLVGQEHGKFVTKISKLKVKKFILVTFMFCLALPLSKVFAYKPNYFRPDHAYPDEIELAQISKALKFIYLSSSILYSLISSLGFILANLFVDINILRAMKQVIAEREKNTSRAIQSNEIQKKKNENRAVHRVVKLIILNATVGLTLKSLMAVNPIFTIYHQLAALKSYNLIVNPVLLKDVSTCINNHVCNALDAIGRSLLLVNLSIPLFFFYKFDLKFNECFKNLVANMKKKLKSRKN